MMIQLSSLALVVGLAAAPQTTLAMQNSRGSDSRPTTPATTTTAVPPIYSPTVAAPSVPTTYALPSRRASRLAPTHPATTRTTTHPATTRAPLLPLRLLLRIPNSPGPQQGDAGSPGTA